MAMAVALSEGEGTRARYSADSKRRNGTFFTSMLSLTPAGGVMPNAGLQR